VNLLGADVEKSNDVSGLLNLVSIYKLSVTRATTSFVDDQIERKRNKPQEKTSAVQPVTMLGAP